MALTRKARFKFGDAPVLAVTWRLTPFPRSVCLLFDRSSSGFASIHVSPVVILNRCFCVDAMSRPRPCGRRQSDCDCTPNSAALPSSLLLLSMFPGCWFSLLCSFFPLSCLLTFIVFFLLFPPSAHQALGLYCKYTSCQSLRLTVLQCIVLVFLLFHP